jgi:hypothetical protein
VQNYAASGSGLKPARREDVIVTTKNQITLPKKVVARFTGVEYFEVNTDGECIVLRRSKRAGRTKSAPGLPSWELTMRMSPPLFRGRVSTRDRSLVDFICQLAAAWLGVVSIGMKGSARP